MPMNVDVGVHVRREPGDVGVQDRDALGAQLLKDRIRVWSGAAIVVGDVKLASASVSSPSAYRRVSLPGECVRRVDVQAAVELEAQPLRALHV
jgi:hypothetical protein